MKIAKIDVTKIDKAHLFKGNKGTYLDLVLMENKDGPDKFGNDGFCVQGVSKEARAQGVKGPIIGNWKHVETGRKPQQPKAQTKPDPSVTVPEDDVPF